MLQNLIHKLKSKNSNMDFTNKLYYNNIYRYKPTKDFKTQ